MVSMAIAASSCNRLPLLMMLLRYLYSNRLTEIGANIFKDMTSLTTL